MGRGVAGVGAQGGLERGARFVNLVLVGIEHAQVVVGLRQLREFFGQPGESADRVCRLAGVALGYALEQAHLRITRFARQKAVGPGERLRKLAVTRELGYVAVFVGMGGCAEHRKHKGNQRHCKGQSGAAKLHGVRQISLGQRATKGRRYTVAHCSGGVRCGSLVGPFYALPPSRSRWRGPFVRLGLV